MQNEGAARGFEKRRNRHRKIIDAIESVHATRAERFNRLKKIAARIGSGGPREHVETTLSELAAELSMTFDQVAAVYQLFSGWPPEGKTK